MVPFRLELQSCSHLIQFLTVYTEKPLLELWWTGRSVELQSAHLYDSSL